MSAWQPIHPAALVVGNAVSIRRHYGAGAGHPATSIILAGRVVSASETSVSIEWTTVTGTALHPPRLHIDERMSRSDLERCRLRHMPSQSPTERTDEAGNAFMLALLRSACRHDTQVLASCMNPETGVRIGADAANALLGGRATVREWHIRQCDGRLAKPRTIRSQTADPDVLAIMRAMPGAQVRIVRLHTPADDSADPKTA